MLNHLKRRFEYFGINYGLCSVALRAITTSIRLILIAVMCRTISKNDFLSLQIFFSVSACIPFFDLGIAGLAFRKRILAPIDTGDKKVEEYVFSSTFFRLVKLYSRYAVIACLIALFFKNISSIAIALMVLRYPLTLVIEYFISKSKVLIAYGLDFFEQFIALSILMIFFGILEVNQIQVLYSLILFCFHLFVFLIFIRNKNWQLTNHIFIDKVSKEETLNFVQNGLANSFFITAPFVVNFFYSQENAWEFHIGFRLFSLILGSIAIFFNPILSRLIILDKNNFLPLKEYFFLILGLASINLCLWIYSYPDAFKLLSGKYPMISSFKWELGIIGSLFFLFLGLDQILKIKKMIISICVWVCIYILWFLYFMFFRNLLFFIEL